eukprot:9680236-Alexandrium_andersonii.AAC.1
MQDLVKQGRLKLIKVPGLESGSNLMAKHVDRQTLVRERSALGIVLEEKEEQAVSEVGRAHGFVPAP